MTGPSIWEGGGGSERPVGQLQTTRNQEQATASQGQVTSGRQGWTAGRAGALRVREECWPLPCTRHSEQESPFWALGLGEVGLSNDRFPASGPILPISHTQPSRVSQEGTVGGSTGRHPPTEEPGLLLWVVVLLLLTSQTVQLLTTQPGGTGAARQVGAWEGESQRPVGLRTTNHSAFIFPHHLRLALGCLPGRQGAEVGTPSHLHDKPLPGVVWWTGRGALCP